jgi:predicted ester cyclase
MVGDNAERTTDEEEPTSETLRYEYGEICRSHQSIADFRGRLLGLLPLASGTGIFLLAESELATDSSAFLIAAGLFGAVVTLGLYLYEKRGMKECLLLRERGENLERRLGLGPNVAQFQNNRPGFVGPQGAGPIVYFAVVAAWLFVAVYGLPRSHPPLELVLGLVIAMAFLIAVVIAAFPFITRTRNTSAEAKQIVRRFIEELWDQSRTHTAEKILAPTCTAHFVGWPFADGSRDGNDPSFRGGFRQAFPDHMVKIHHITAERQPNGRVLVAAWSSFSGTHRGQLYDSPATGRHVMVHGYWFFRIEDGRITDYWTLWDWHGLFGQLGLAVPIPIGAPAGPPQGNAYSYRERTQTQVGP